MVQCLLSCRAKKLRAVWLVCALLLLAAPASAGKPKKAAPAELPPDLLLEGGRKLTFERALSSERDIRGKPGFWKKLVDVVIGAPE